MRHFLLVPSFLFLKLLLFNFILTYDTFHDTCWVVYNTKVYLRFDFIKVRCSVAFLRSLLRPFEDIFKQRVEAPAAVICSLQAVSSFFRAWLVSPNLSFFKVMLSSKTSIFDDVFHVFRKWLKFMNNFSVPFLQTHKATAQRLWAWCLVFFSYAALFASFSRTHFVSTSLHGENYTIRFNLFGADGVL